MSDKSRYQEVIFEFTDGTWWRIEEDPDNPEYEYEVPVKGGPASVWGKINELKRHGWETKTTPEGSNRIILFKREDMTL